VPDSPTTQEARPVHTLTFVFTTTDGELRRERFTADDIAGTYAAFAEAYPVGSGTTLHYTESGPVAPLVVLG
jgi:hypothetical protein